MKIGPCAVVEIRHGTAGLEAVSITDLTNKPLLQESTEIRETALLDPGCDQVFVTGIQPKY